MSTAPNLERVLKYANRTAYDQGVQELQRLGAQRFLNDLESGRWDFKTFLPEFCISLMTGLFCFAQGERLDGTPMRGKPFELMDWHLFVTYNVCGFFLKGTNIRRFTECDIFAPRKTVKTTFSEALQTALVMYYRKSGAKAKTVAGSRKQGLEGFDWLKYNFLKLGLVEKNNPPGKLRMLDSSMGNSFEGDFWDGHIELETLAFKPELFDSFNCAFVHLDELELYKNAIPYTRLRDGMKAMTNKLLIASFTAGDNPVGFAAQHRDYMEKILRGAITGPPADRTFVFLAQAPTEPDGSVDFTNPDVHRACNPAYGITIRPEDMIAAAQQAEHNPMLRKEFFTRSLNLFVGSYKAWFDLSEFRQSDEHWGWTQTELIKLVKNWYGGADLSKLHDLTAACIVGEVPQKDAAEWIKARRSERKPTGEEENPEWAPTEDVLVILPHCWFPAPMAAEKADQDQIPLFGWRDDGWLDMPETASMDPTEPVKQFNAWRERGYNIKQVGHDRKFGRTYFAAMRKAHFKIKDQPQYYMQKSEGFRHIEHKAKIGCLYYLHAEPFEYCISNVKATEKVDDAIQYEKIEEHARIDVFDAAVFATIRMLIDTERSSAGEWFKDSLEDKRHPLR